MHIRQAKQADAPALSMFNQSMAFETEGIKLNPEIIDAGVSAMLENPSMGFYLVAETDGKIVASLMVTTEWSDWRNGLFWWIQSVYVLPEFRRQGLYRLLYQQVKSLSESQDNVCGFRLYVEQQNQNAQQTYRSLGMQETHYKLFEELKTDTFYLK